MGALKKSGGYQGQWGHWSGSMGAWRKGMVAFKRVNGISDSVGQGQWGYWKVNGGSMRVLKRVNWRRWSGSVALVRVNGGIEKGQWWHWSGLMVALKSQWWVNAFIEKGQLEALVRVSGIGQGQWWHWKVNGGWMVVLKRVNWRRWSGSVALARVNGGIEKGQQGCGCGLSYMTLQGCNLYLAGL